MKKIGLIAALLMSAAPALGDAPVTAITLFEAGLAEVTRVQGEAVLASDTDISRGYPKDMDLIIPGSQIDDVLKSLLLPVSARVRLDGEAAVEDAFARLRIGPDQLGDLGVFLDAIRGAMVTLSGPAGFSPVYGRVLGVSRADCPDDGPCVPVLLLQAGPEIRALPLIPDRSVRLEDPELRSRLADALEALERGGSGTDKTLRIETDGTGPINLSYVIPAPTWRTAYRAVSGTGGEMRLQAWAVLENATGADWDGVSLTLSSGAPRTLRADLTGRDWGQREDYDPAQKGAPMRPLFRDAQAEGLMAFAAMPAELEVETEMSDRGLDSRFTFPFPIDLAQGEIISLPFLAETLPVERSLIWRGSLSDRTGNPDLMLGVRNPLQIRLPAGIMTVSDETGYLGDAAFPTLTPGAEAEVRFGADQRIEVRETVSSDTSERRVLVRKGAIKITERRLRTTLYQVPKAPEGAGELEILHPIERGWTLASTGTPPENASTDPNFHRFSLPLFGDAGAVLEVREERPVSESWLISDLPRDRIVALMRDQIPSADRDYLERVLALQEEIITFRSDLDRLGRDRDREVSDQDRARRMMEAAPAGSDMQVRFLQTIMGAEDRIALIDGRIREVETGRVSAEERLDVLLAQETP